MRRLTTAPRVGVFMIASADLKKHKSALGEDGGE